MSYYDIINCARYRMPVSMLENIFVYSDWYAELDDKTRACAEDEMQRWSRRHKLQKERFKEYMDVALAMATDENYDVYDAETYATWRRYSAAHCRLNILSTTVTFLISAALLCCNVHAAFASLFGSGVFPQLCSIVILECVVDAD